MFCYGLFNPPQPRWPPLRGLKQTLEHPLFNRHAVRITRGPGSTFESSPWCWCCWRFLCLCEVVDVPVSWCLPVYSDSLCTANHSSRLQAQTDSVMDGPRSIFRSTKKAKSHIIAVQLTWTEWLIWTYSHFHLPLLPLHQLLLSSLTFNFFKHPFTVLSPFGVSVAPLTSSSTSHWWAG